MQCNARTCAPNPRQIACPIATSKGVAYRPFSHRRASTWPLSVAMWTGVLPQKPKHSSIAAPWITSSRCPSSHARANDDSSSGPRRFTSQPDSIKKAATSKCSFWSAKAKALFQRRPQPTPHRPTMKKKAYAQITEYKYIYIYYMKYIHSHWLTHTGPHRTSYPHAKTRAPPQHYH